MLYIKTRVTFRVDDELADALRELPNQTKFVEDALRDALGRACRTCHGSGRVPLRALRVTNVRGIGVRRLHRDEAVELQKVFRLGQEVAATRIELRKHGRRVGFTLRRGKAELLDGILTRGTEN
jgi:Arc/MetJ family transcription regulator